MKLLLETVNETVESNRGSNSGAALLDRLPSRSIVSKVARSKSMVKAQLTAGGGAGSKFGAANQLISGKPGHEGVLMCCARVLCAPTSGVVTSTQTHRKANRQPRRGGVRP